MSVDYKDRCCGRFAPSPMHAAENSPENTCSHEFFLVRIDRKTGEISHIPNIDGPVATARLTVEKHEWREGAPE
jgi:hypothetical protein